MEDPIDGFQPVLPFDSDSVEFARGFEAGRLWGLLQRTSDEVVEVVRGDNVEMVMRIGEALGRPVRGESLDDDWTSVVFPASDSDDETVA